MKQSIIVKFYMFFFVSIFFICNAKSQESYDHDFESQNTIIMHDAINIDVCTALHALHKIYKNIEEHEQQLPFDSSMQDDCLHEILTILVETYEKIVGATATYYIMINLPIQHNLHQRIAIILAEDIIKIMHVLGKQLLRYIFHQQLTMWQKAQYCAFIIVIIGIVKLGIDTIPQTMQSQQSPAFGIPDNVESVYLKEKFNNYR